MVNKSRWKAAHDRFPAHVDEARNSDGIVHRGYHLLEFRVAAELLRVGPAHSAEDFWAPNDWQLLLVVAEYMSALLEFLDWFWPDLGWEHHKQAIVLSKRLLQPRSPQTYANLPIDPQLRAAWQSFTYAFWHGTRHLPAAAPPGEPASEYTAAREWLTKLVGDRGFKAEGHIMTALQTWIQAMQPRLQEAFPSVDWSHWPAVVWPDPECACRTVEKRGAIKRQQEEDYAVRWPLRVTQGRPKFNHLKVEARDGFNVAIPPVKNPPALGFLAVSDVMCAFKQATQKWGPTQPSSPTYAAQQEVVMSFVQNVLREDRGPLAPGIAHEQYKYLGYVACSMLGWQNAMLHLTGPLLETAAWGPQPLAFPGGAAALLRQQPDAASAAFGLNLGLGLGQTPLDLGLRLEPGLPQPQQQEHALQQHLQQHAQQLLQPHLQHLHTQPYEPDTAAHAACHAPLPLPAQPNGPVASSIPVEVGFAQPAHDPGPTPMPIAEVQTKPAPSGSGPILPDRRATSASMATRTRPSPFLTKPSQGSSVAKPVAPSTTTQGQQQAPPLQQQPQLQQPLPHADAAQAPPLPQQLLDGPGAMSLGGLSSMQDLIDQLPSHTDLFWSALFKSSVDEDGRAGGGAGPSGTPARAPPPPPPPLLQPHPPPPAANTHLGDALPLRNGQALGHGSITQQQQPPPPLPLQEQLEAQAAAKAQEPPPSDLAPPGLPSLQPFDSSLPYGTLQYPLFASGGLPLLSRGLPDAAVQIHPPCRTGSPFQGTITTGCLPSTSTLLGALLSTEGTSQEPRLGRRSHGEVFTLSPVASCGGAGDTAPSTPAVALEDATGAQAAAAATPAAVPGRRTPERRAPADLAAVARPNAVQELAQLPTAGRRTRQDVARAAALAASDAGLEPAPGSMVEPCPKRTYSVHQGGRPSNLGAPCVTAERVESLGAFLTDQEAGLALRPVGQHDQPTSSVPAHACPASTLESAGKASQQLAASSAAAADNTSGVATAAASTETGTAAGQSSQAVLREQLCELLQRADAVASQLLEQDPQGASAVVFQAMRSTVLIFQWAQHGLAQQPSLS